MKESAVKVAAAMSGGVDSSVAAALLAARGFTVTGLTMKLFCYSGADRATSCCSLDSIDAARQAAGKLGIPHYVVDCEREFERDVVDRFVDEYQCGRTPNPCVACNQTIKFGLLLDKARALGCDYLATGHYARIKQHQGRPALARGSDEKKDQSYFLWPLTRETLSHVMFPLGGLTKQQVRAKARQLDFSSADRPESQEICFVQDGTYADFLKQRITAVPGEIVDVKGTLLGRHNGIINYTIGQREGLGIALGRPQYVLRIDAARNQIIVGDDHLLWARECAVSQVNWMLPMPQRAVRALVKIRHQHKGAQALVKPLSQNTASITFGEPQRAVTPGQSAVFY
ncbi:MAG TPA: tRNA 2-thiouridine(34) synthase MnmA, partial [Candidatus Edwardsbacteria bacterium]|nr:tRNA 2-thiouridine(34) synthase MnmA [Candidatus Edwardsbacteria bacterium]